MKKIIAILIVALAMFSCSVKDSPKPCVNIWQVNYEYNNGDKGDFKVKANEGTFKISINRNGALTYKIEGATRNIYAYNVRKFEVKLADKKCPEILESSESYSVEISDDEIEVM